MKEVRIAILRLRRDALERGMLGLAIMYGESAIRIGAEIIAAHRGADK